MELVYKNKLSEQEILQKNNGYKLVKQSSNIAANKLIEGDNIHALHELIQDNSIKGNVDLIYIDPPFATKNIFRIDENNRVATISKSNNGTVAYSDSLTGIEFIEFIRERLILLKTLLSNKGSIYLHIDYKIGHYVKVMMDEVFGIDNFRNDITRIKCNPKNFSRKAYGNVKDLILFYSKTNDIIWNDPKLPYSDADVEKLFPKTLNGRRYTTVPIHAPGETKNGNTNKPFKGMMPPVGRHWRTDVKELERLDQDGLIEWSSKGNPRMIIFADERSGKKMQDIWEFKDPQYPSYPTEKNSDMLDMVIKTSSNENSIVLDCFCGSGSTILGAINNKRRWIGIDKSKQAIKATIKKISSISNDLESSYKEYEYYKVVKK